MSNPTNDQLIEMLRDCAFQSTDKIAAEFTNPADDFVAMMLLASADGQCVVANVSFRDDREKEMMSTNVMPRLITQTAARAVATIFSGWMVMAKHKPDGSGTHGLSRADLATRPSQHPDRQEILALTIISVKSTETYHAPIQRDGVHPPKLGDWTLFPATSSVGLLYTPLLNALKLNEQGASR